MTDYTITIDYKTDDEEQEVPFVRITKMFNTEGNELYLDNVLLMGRLEDALARALKIMYADE